MVSTIPWIHGFDWQQMVTAVSHTIARMEDAEQLQIKEHVRQMSQIYQQINQGLEILSLQTCATCLDVCCLKATVWYDLKDILYIFFATGQLPPQQICRRADQSCCHLSPTGCDLERDRRPFICTWYICSRQKEHLEIFEDTMAELVGRIEELKSRRNRLEQLYIEVTCGSVTD